MRDVGLLMHLPAFAVLRRSPPVFARFPTVGHFSFSSLAFSAVPGCPLEAFRHGAGTGHLPSPFHSDVYSKNYQFSCSSSFPNALRLSVGWGRSSPTGRSIVAPLRPSGYEHDMYFESLSEGLT
jgi:hypothetical protein